MNRLTKLWRFISRKEIIAVIVISVSAGFILRGGGQKEPLETGSHVHDAAEETKAEVWTCSMHPQIRQPGPGQCPICGMDLIPVTTESDGGNLAPRELKLSAAAEKLAGIQVVPVKRQFVEKEIRMVGKVASDETRIRYITAWLPGRIDRLFVDYTGIPVQKGDHLAELYSPELYTAQEELIQALRAAEELRNSSLATTRETALRTVESSREKLRLLGLTDEQIRDFEEKGEPAEHVTIYSPIAGTVIHKNAAEGMYVNTGSKIYTIADFSKVWVLLDVYESDLAWIRYGQDVEFRTEAYPGETFKGKIAFIDPLLDDKTRTVKVRVNVDNTDGRLKPDMFVNAVVYSNVAFGGKVIDPSLAGKYICPMHPEIVKHGPGECDICTMPLVTAESLGYASLRIEEPPLVIPASAPLITGKRAVVYVAVPGRDGVFAGREVVLGPRAGDYYLIEKGLDEGESVVVNGNFKIDSAVQIQAKPSMMTPANGGAAAEHRHGDEAAMPAVQPADMEHEQMSDRRTAGKESEEKAPDAFLSQLDEVYDAYFHIQFALSHDNAGEARSGAEHLGRALAGVDMELLTGDAHMAWMKEYETIRNAGTEIAESDNIDTARSVFISLSQAMINVAGTFGTSGETGVYRFHCPMAADNKGADWLQNKTDLENPFYGSSMFKCGDLVDTLSVEK